MFFMDLAGSAIQWLVLIFLFLIGVAVLALAFLFVVDRLQTGDAVRRNYPVIGRFRHLFSTLGEFFRQYFFAMDREELPFNRAQREWVKRAANGKDNTVAFGSTRNITIPGTPLFVNAAFPPLDEQVSKTQPLVIGERARHPYAAPSIVNISGMSFGAISRPAVLALSRGAKEAGLWINTGEGGLSPHHLQGGGDIVFQIGTAKYGVRDDSGKLDDDKLRAVASHDQGENVRGKDVSGCQAGQGRHPAWRQSHGRNRCYSSYTRRQRQHFTEPSRRGQRLG